MRVSLLLVAVLGLTTAAPQLRFSGKTYIALQEALGGRVPVSVSSANKIYHAYEYSDDHVVLLNLPGLGAASLGSGEDSLEGSYGVGGIDARVARTAATAELIEDAIDAAGDRAENEARVAAVNQAIRSGVPITVALQRGETAGEAAENAAELEATRQVLASLSRKKRQTDDDDDFQLSTADQVSFALSSLGTLFGSHLGRYLDDTFEANEKFIDRMEGLGLLVVNQAENMLTDKGSDENGLGFGLFR